MSKAPPKPLKIAVYAICLNEEKFVDRFMDAVAEADLVVIADTGSTDGTVAAFERRGVTPHRIDIKPWRFDRARNAALALVPDDVDICISLDIDEVIMPDWRRVVESAWRRANINHIYYTHAWSRDVTGLWHRLLDNRIHARHGFVWRYACHECVVPNGVSDEIGVVRHLVIEHHPDPKKDRSSYLPLLELAAAEEPDNPRHVFYLGREYTYAERFDDALRELERFLQLQPNGGEGGLQCATRRHIIRIHEQKGDEEKALALLKDAAAAAPNVRGPQIDLAWALYQREAWEACYDAALKAIAIPEEVVEYGCDTDTGVLPEDMAAICGWRLGHFEQALIFGRQAMAKAPDVDRIRKNVERMELALAATPAR